jgi:hypothetical protein
MTIASACFDLPGVAGRDGDRRPALIGIAADALLDARRGVDLAGARQCDRQSIQRPAAHHVAEGFIGGLLGGGKILIGVRRQTGLDARGAEIGERERSFVGVVDRGDVARRQGEHARARRLRLAAVPRRVGAGRSLRCESGDRQRGQRCGEGLGHGRGSLCAELTGGEKAIRRRITPD